MSLKKQKNSPVIKCESLYKIFGDMIYVHGFVHCDPHPGNLMVRQDPDNPQRKFQVVVLDHGMYRERKSPCQTRRDDERTQSSPRDAERNENPREITSQAKALT